MKNNILFLLLLCTILLSCKETKYDNDSFVRIEIYTKQNIEDLHMLCKVWGFMRFHHPNIVQGEDNWDYELFRVMPSILKSSSKDERNKILLKWIKKQGSVKPQLDSIEVDSIKLALDFSWMNSADLGDAANELLKIKNAQKDFYPKRESVLLVDTILKKDNVYMWLPSYPDVGYRLLTLFRYWNIIEYFFPYKYLIGEDWDKILLDFIPQFIEVDNEIDYHMLILKLAASINDTHAYMNDPIINNHIGQKMPLLQVSFIENKAVVTELYGEYEVLSIKRGDIIFAINNKPVDSLVNEWLPYTSASNYPTKLRNIANIMLKTNDDRLKVSYKRNGLLMSDSLITFPVSRVVSFFKNKNDKPLYQLIGDKICYIYLGSQQGGTMPDSVDAKGIIIDLRCYPSQDKIKGYWNFLPLYPEPTECVNFTAPILPGLFVYYNYEYSTMAGKVNPNYFKGKKVIIVNEETQSHAEFMAMRYQCAPNSVVIGSTTAGADGNIFYFTLPGNIRTLITGLGVYYPDGRETQRVGIVPDIEVKPTIKGLHEGRDELLEVAIRIINDDN